jgi:hypothetical protein
MASNARRRRAIHWNVDGLNRRPSKIRHRTMKHPSGETMMAMMRMASFRNHAR